MEMDLIEANGNCLMQTTWHTNPDLNGGCDEDGCAAQAHISSTSVVNSSFSTDGYMTTRLNGAVVGDYSPSPDASAAAVVKSTMQSIGAALWSSQWSVASFVSLFSLVS